MGHLLTLNMIKTYLSNDYYLGLDGEIHYSIIKYVYSLRPDCSTND